MSQDPFLEQEEKKYEFPAPSREFILDYLAKRKIPASREDLSKELNICSKDQLEGLRRRLRAMERDGQLIFTRRQCYAIPKNLELLQGTVIGHRDGFGFLRVEGSTCDYYLSTEQMKTVVHGDIVIAKFQEDDKRGRREVRIIRILMPKIRQIVGRLFLDSGNIFVVPDDSRINFNIFISHENMIDAKIGFIVVVELIQRPTRYSKAIGKVIEILGDKMGTIMAINIALRTHEIPYIWSHEVEKQISVLKKDISEDDKLGRIDLRSFPFMTIDGEDANDFDDAVYCEKIHNIGWRLWVAISDVSYYVPINTPLDKEANRRATSIYFPSKVIPMLPEVLSNGLCSLNPKVDRLSIVCEMNISYEGILLSYKFYEAVIHSNARLTYNNAWKILQGNKNLRANYRQIIKPLSQLYEMYQALEKARVRRGGISFETDEAKFIFNNDLRIDRIECVTRNNAHKLIEECMIMANIAAARFVEKNKEPALYRVHDRPSQDRISLLRTILSEFGLILGGRENPEPKDYADMMALISKKPGYEILQTMLIRSMKQAIYHSENRGHFGLALQTYAHFTSPIRRYPDLLLHRAIKYQLGKQNINKELAINTGGWHYELSEMLRFGIHCSVSERRADEATRDVNDWLKCDFMKNYVGKRFIGIITTVTGFGFFVRIKDLFIDGLVHVSSLDNDYYRYDNTSQRLIGESSGCIYRIGDIVKIRVAAVYMENRRIDFSIISSYQRSKNNKKTNNRYQNSSQVIPDRNKASILCQNKHNQLDSIKLGSKFLLKKNSENILSINKLAII